MIKGNLVLLQLVREVCARHKHGEREREREREEFAAAVARLTLLRLISLMSDRER